MHNFDWNNGIRLGLLLGFALIAGKLAKRAHLPKVTAYLLVGMAMGPSLIEMLRDMMPTDRDGVVGQMMRAIGQIAGELHLGADSLTVFEPLTKLAIALVLFNLGCNFPLVRIRRIMRRTLRLSLGELSVTFLLVTVGLILLGQPWQGALLLGALALATAPATTILVLKETESDGQVTEFANAMVAVNNLVSIVLFELLFLGVYFYYQSQADVVISSQASGWTELQTLGIDLFGSVLFGIVAGLLVSIAYSLVDAQQRLIMLVGVLILVLGVTQLNDMPYLLTFLAMGVTVANSSEHTRQILGELDRFTGLLCIIFFVAHGAELEIDKLGTAGLIGFGYLIYRLFGKLLGTWLAATWGREEPVIRRHLGPTLLAQAGAAIALSAIAVERSAHIGGEFHDMCLQIQIVILGTVAIFELVGPIMIQRSVIQAGEVSLANAVSHPSEFGVSDIMRTLCNRVLVAIGRDPWQKRPTTEIKVRELMRTNEPPMQEAATFDEVIHYIEHSRNDTYPVVDRDDLLIGIIRYPQLSTVLFDPMVGSLVRAADLATSARLVLLPDMSAYDAYELFESIDDDCLPVVTPEHPHKLLGMVRRRDIFRLLIRKQLGPTPEPEEAVKADADPPVPTDSGA